MATEVPIGHCDRPPDDGTESTQITSILGPDDPEQAFPPSEEVFNDDPVPRQYSVLRLLVLGPILFPSALMRHTTPGDLRVIRIYAMSPMIHL
jgi:hypothetical protein